MGKFSQWFFSVGVQPDAVVHSKSMSLLFYFLVCGFTVYMVLDLILMHRYAEMIPASANINLWKSSPREAIAGHDAAYYCNNKSYDWLLTPEHMSVLGPYRMESLPCKWYSDVVVVSLAESSFGLTTIVYEDTKSESGLDGKYYLTTRLETSRINFQHSVETPSGTVLNPKSELVDHRGNVYMRTGYEGSPKFFTLTLNDVENILGVTLENYNPQATGVFSTDLPPIRYRNTGMDVAMRMNYFNVEDWKAGMETRCKISLLLQRGNWGTLGSAMSRTGDGLDRFGVRVVMKVEGRFADVSFYRILMHIIGSVVLLSISKTIVLFAIKLLREIDDSFRPMIEHEMEISMPAVPQPSVHESSELEIRNAPYASE